MTFGVLQHPKVIKDNMRRLRFASKKEVMTVRIRKNNLTN